MDYKKFKKDCIEYYIETSMQYLNDYYSEFHKNPDDFTELEESKLNKLREFYLNKKHQSVLNYINNHIKHHKSGDWKGATVHSPFIKLQISGIAERNEKRKFWLNYFKTFGE